MASRKVRLHIAPDAQGDPVFIVIDVESGETIDGVVDVAVEPIIVAGVNTYKYQATITIRTFDVVVE